jgi:predicted RNA-binding protein with TRAM domain
MERRFSRPRFGNRGFEGGFEKPVKIGETYDVEIKEVGSRGDGIARVKNFVIFVPNTKKGEKCKIKINQVSRRFAVGEKVSETKGEEEITEEEPSEEDEKEEEED